MLGPQHRRYNQDVQRTRLRLRIFARLTTAGRMPVVELGAERIFELLDLGGQGYREPLGSPRRSLFETGDGDSLLTRRRFRIDPTNRRIDPDRGLIAPAGRVGVRHDVQESPSPTDYPPTFRLCNSTAANRMRCPKTRTGSASAEQVDRSRGRRSTRDYRGPDARCRAAGSSRPGYTVTDRRPLAATSSRIGHRAAGVLCHREGDAGFTTRVSSRSTACRLMNQR